MEAMVSDAGSNVSFKPPPTPVWDFSCDLEVDYGSNDHANIVYSALAVDKELQPDKVKRQMSVSDGRLIVHFEAVEARVLRASFSALVELMILTTQIIEEYGQNDCNRNEMSLS